MGRDKVPITRGLPILKGSSVKDETKWLPGTPRPITGNGAPIPFSPGRTLPSAFAVCGVPFCWLDRWLDQGSV